MLIWINLLVYDGGIIQIYELGKQEVRLNAELHIRPEDGCDDRMEIAKMAFSPGSRDLAVLYRYCSRIQVFNEHGSAEWIPYRPNAFNLVTFHYCFAQSKGHFYDSYQQETRHISIREVEVPVGLAIASNGTACIVLQNTAKQCHTHILLVERDNKLMDTCTYGKQLHSN